MKVFISWSGELSGKVANLFREWIPSVLQFVEPWLSQKDLEAGSVWFGEIGKELSETSFGILCLTSENLNAPWLLFEAGGLFKGLAKNRVCPMLVDVVATDVKPPLSQLNLNEIDMDGTSKLIRAINAQAGEKQLPEERVSKAFEKWWPDFQSKFADIVRSSRASKPTPARSVEDKIEEILTLCRGTNSELGHLRKYSDVNKISASLVDAGDSELTLMESMERNTIIQALKETGGNKQETARRLGIGRQTLYNKLKAYSIEE